MIYMNIISDHVPPSLYSLSMGSIFKGASLNCLGQLSAKDAIRMSLLRERKCRPVSVFDCKLSNIVESSSGPKCTHWPPTLLKESPLNRWKEIISELREVDLLSQKKCCTWKGHSFSKKRHKIEDYGVMMRKIMQDSLEIEGHLYKAESRLFGCRKNAEMNSRMLELTTLWSKELSHKLRLASMKLRSSIERAILISVRCGNKASPHEIINNVSKVNSILLIIEKLIFPLIESGNFFCIEEMIEKNIEVIHSANHTILRLQKSISEVHDKKLKRSEKNKLIRTTLKIEKNVKKRILILEKEVAEMNDYLLREYPNIIHRKNLEISLLESNLVKHKNSIKNSILGNRFAPENANGASIIPRVTASSGTRTQSVESISIWSIQKLREDICKMEHFLYFMRYH